MVASPGSSAKGPDHRRLGVRAVNAKAGHRIGENSGFERSASIMASFGLWGRGGKRFQNPQLKQETDG